jgi:hypothetical protein
MTPAGLPIRIEPCLATVPSRAPLRQSARLVHWTYRMCLMGWLCLVGEMCPVGRLCLVGWLCLVGDRAVAGRVKTVDARRTTTHSATLFNHM